MAKVVEKEPAVCLKIKKLIEKSILFSSLNNEDLGIVIGAMEVVVAQPGQAIITEGERGDTLYIIDSGEYNCFKVLSGK